MTKLRPPWPSPLLVPTRLPRALRVKFMRRCCRRLALPPRPFKKVVTLWAGPKPKSTLLAPLCPTPLLVIRLGAQLVIVVAKTVVLVRIKVVDVVLNTLRVDLIVRHRRTGKQAFRRIGLVTSTIPVFSVAYLLVRVSFTPLEEQPLTKCIGLTPLQAGFVATTIAPFIRLFLPVVKHTLRRWTTPLGLLTWFPFIRRSVSLFAVGLTTRPLQEWSALRPPRAEGRVHTLRLTVGVINIGVPVERQAATSTPLVMLPVTPLTAEVAVGVTSTVLVYRLRLIRSP